jgi:hypothetical protein
MTNQVGIQPAMPGDTREQKQSALLGCHTLQWLQCSPLVIKHDNRKSPLNGHFNGHIIEIGEISQQTMFD